MRKRRDVVKAEQERRELEPADGANGYYCAVPAITSSAKSATAAASTAHPKLAGVLLGIGFGGFVDGILLHQILQWHHMLTAEGCCSSSTVGGIQDNTLADGLFHVSTWIALLVGTVLMIRGWQGGGRPAPWSWHLGLWSIGWGLFNVVEGVIDHHILQIHHVRDDVADSLPWDLGFLAFGALLIVGGLLLARRHQPRNS